MNQSMWPIGNGSRQGADLGRGLGLGLTHLPHGLQLLLFGVIGSRQLLHAGLQVLLLCLQPAPLLPAPQTGLAVRGGQAQTQQTHTRLDGCGPETTRSEGNDGEI